MTLPRILFCIAALCFFIALLVALGAVGGNAEAWQDGGLIATALGLVNPVFVDTASRS